MDNNYDEGLSFEQYVQKHSMYKSTVCTKAQYVQKHSMYKSIPVLYIVVDRFLHYFGYPKKFCIVCIVYSL